MRDRPVPRAAVLAVLAAAIVWCFTAAVELNEGLSIERADFAGLEREWRDIQLQAAVAGYSQEQAVYAGRETGNLQRQLSELFGLPWLVLLQKIHPRLQEQASNLRERLTQLTGDPDATPAGLRARIETIGLEFSELGDQINACVAARRRVTGITLASMATLLTLLGAVCVRVNMRARLANERKTREQARVLVEVQEVERLRISRTLHDGAAQDLSAARLASETLLDGLEGTPADLRERVSRLSELIKSSLRTIRQVAFDLHPREAGQAGLVGSLSRLCDSYGKMYAQEMEFQSAGMDGLCLAPTDEANLYGIAQEAVANAARHAHAHRVTVSLISPGSGLILRIRDDGVGFDYDRTCAEAVERKCLGLLTMRERATLLGASLDLVSRPGRGTEIRVTMNNMGNQDGAAQKSFARG